MANREIIPVGRLQVATPTTMAQAVRAGTVATEAVDERIQAVAAAIIAADPALKASAAQLATAAVAAEIVSRNLVGVGTVADTDKVAMTDETGQVLIDFNPDGSLSQVQRDRWRGQLFPGAEGMAPRAAGGAFSAKLGAIANGSVKYLYNVWFPQVYGSQVGTYLTLPGDGVSESSVRPSCEAVFAMAGLIHSGEYRGTQTGIEQAAVEAVAVKLVKSIVHAHRATTPGGWGGGERDFTSANSWQAAMWAYLVGSAGWMISNLLDTTTRAELDAMVLWEANRFVHYVRTAYRTGDQIHFFGDSKTEEIAWNTSILALAIIMFPEHANSERWMAKLTEMTVLGMSRPSDAYSTARVNGQRVRDLNRGASNINEDGTITNHGVIHPDYMSAVADFWMNIILLARAGHRMQPEALSWNASLVYSALTDRTFTSPPFQAPGGTIYGPMNPKAYYPQSGDWGENRIVQFAVIDTIAHVVGFDKLSTTTALSWANVHADGVAAQQARGTTGQIYQPSDGNVSASVEQWSASLVVKALLASKTDPGNIFGSDGTPELIMSQNRT